MKKEKNKKIINIKKGEVNMNNIMKVKSIKEEIDQLKDFVLFLKEQKKFDLKNFIVKEEDKEHVEDWDTVISDSEKSIFLLNMKLVKILKDNLINE